MANNIPTIENLEMLQIKRTFVENSKTPELVSKKSSLVGDSASTPRSAFSKL